LSARGLPENTASMKKLGMILLALYLIVDSLLGFGLNLGPLIFLVYLIGLAAGILILIGAMKSSG
jgi:hypothetical protein